MLSFPLMDGEPKLLIINVTNADEFSTSFICAWLDDTIMVFGEFQEPLIEVSVIVEVLYVTCAILIDDNAAPIDIL